jgi:hypothetical protein
MTKQKVFNSKEDIYILFNDITPTTGVQIYDVYKVLKTANIELEELRDYAIQNNINVSITTDQIEVMTDRVKETTTLIATMLTNLVEKERAQDFEECAKIKVNIDSLINGLVQDNKIKCDSIGLDLRAFLETTINGLNEIVRN